jgi:tetratricopeptide (TPR) repeat protein
MAKKASIALLAVLAAAWAAAQERPDALRLYRDGRYEEAVQVCLNELQEMPRNMDSYTVMGWSLLALNRPEEAYNQTRKALDVAPYDPRLVQIAGEALYSMGKNREALTYFEQYVTLAPTGGRVASVYYYMGEIYIRLGQYNNADIAFSTALHFEGQNARWWARLGYARESGGDYVNAQDAYENALKLNSGLTEAQRGLESVKKKLAGG